MQWNLCRTNVYMCSVELNASLEDSPFQIAQNVRMCEVMGLMFKLQKY